MGEIYYINRGWSFSPIFDKAYVDPEFDTVSMEKVDIPHSFAETPFNCFDESVFQKRAFYRKDIVIPDSWKNKRVSVVIDGVAHYCEVYINGELKKKNYSGYNSFSVDITNNAGPAETVCIALLVDSSESLDQPPFGNVIDYMTYGGIYRDIFIEVSDPVFVKDVFAFPEFKCDGIYVTSQITVVNPGKDDIKIIQSIDGKEYTKDVLNGSETFDISWKPGELLLWDIDSPVLYDVVTGIIVGGKTVDEYRITTGFRKSEFKKDGYYLNGRKVKIRGLNRHQSFPYVGYAMPASMQRLDADILKNELGVNAVRTSHYPQSPDFIRRCDELGLLVFTEIPGWQHIGGTAWKDIAVENVKSMVIRYRNNPSVILWGVRINESADDDDFYRQTNEAARSLDPTRPTGGVRASKKSHLLEDVYTYNDFVHDGKAKGCEPKRNVTSDTSKPYLISEYNGHMFPTKSFDREDIRREHMIRHAKVLNDVAKNTDIAGSFGWCMFDYNTHREFGSGDRICYHGVTDMFRNKKPAAYLYAALGLKEDVLYIASSMDIGEHPGCDRGATWIVSNADSVRMYKNDRFIKEYRMSDSSFSYLSKGPVMIDDFVGDAIEKNENYPSWVSRRVKKIMNATALYGQANLPLRVLLSAAAVMVFGRLSMKDAVSLYTKYVGDWGGNPPVYRFEAIKNNEVVKTVVKAPSTKVFLETKVSSAELFTKRSYDVSLVRIRAVDENGNVLTYFDEPVSFETEGAVSLTGPRTVSLKGGMSGVYVKSNCDEGAGLLRIRCARCEDVTVDFTVVKEK